MSSYGFYFDSSRCTGCKTCVIACKDKNNLPVGINFRKVIEFSGGNWVLNSQGGWENNVFAYYISLSCNHCADPACVKVCPTKAHKKDPETGLVLIDQSKCIGCGMCAAACPYKVPQLDTKSRKMKKCDACLDLISKNRSPACVEACPQRAIEFGLIDSLENSKKGVKSIRPLPKAEITRPNLLICPPRNYDRIVL